MGATGAVSRRNVEALDRDLHVLLAVEQVVDRARFRARR